ncbi:MAG: thioesterase family protein [Paracoccaceae bacterium]
MFPFIRLAKEMIRAARMPGFETVHDTHLSYHMCWPWDLDAFGELNNGRTLTLLDLGRLGMGYRSGLFHSLRRERWGLTMAGSSVRYRKRIKGFDRFTVSTRVVCWDDKFTYIEQAMWKTDGSCANHALYRAAVTDRDGLVRTPRLAAAMGHESESPPMPEWIANWCTAEATRPWPPLSDATS